MTPGKVALIAALVFAFGLNDEPARAADPHTGTVILKWTAPGDDGWIGKATLYDLRYSTSPINEANYAKAFRLASAPPKHAGSLQSFTISGLDFDRDHYFAIKARDDSGNWSGISNILRVPADQLSTSEPPARLDFRRPWPNPARSVTRFSIDLPRAEHVRIEAFDTFGRRVRSLANGRFSAGSAEIAWDLTSDDGRALPTGIYLVRAQAGREAFLRRISIVR